MLFREELTSTVDPFEEEVRRELLSGKFVILVSWTLASNIFFARLFLPTEWRRFVRRTCGTIFCSFISQFHESPGSFKKYLIPTGCGVQKVSVSNRSLRCATSPFDFMIKMRICWGAIMAKPVLCFWQSLFIYLFAFKNVDGNFLNDILHTSVVERACSLASRAHYTDKGAGNPDPNAWIGLEPHKISIGLV